MTYHVTFSVYAEHFLSINLVCLLVCWPFYNFKNLKPNRLASPFEKKTKDF